MTEWIKCADRLPEELVPVNITWVNREPIAPYLMAVKNIPFVATGVYCHGRWYWWSGICEDMLAEYGHCEADKVAEGIEIVAWKPLPEPYKEM